MRHLRLLKGYPWALEEGELNLGKTEVPLILWDKTQVVPTPQPPIPPPKKKTHTNWGGARLEGVVGGDTELGSSCVHRVKREVTSFPFLVQLKGEVVTRSPTWPDP